MNIIHSNNYKASIKMVFKNDIIRNIKLVLKVLITLAVITSCSLVLSYLYKEIDANKKYYQLKVSLGYSKSDLIKSQIYEFCPIFLFSFLICIFLYFSLFFFIKFFLINYMNHVGFLVNPNIYNLLFVLFLNIILPCFMGILFLYYHFSKTSTISFLDKSEG